MAQHELIWHETALAILRDLFGEIIESQIHQTWGERVVVEAETVRFQSGVVLKASAERSVRAEAYAARCAIQAAYLYQLSWLRAGTIGFPGKTGL